MKMLQFHAKPPLPDNVIPFDETKKALAKKALNEKKEKEILNVITQIHAFFISGGQHRSLSLPLPAKNGHRHREDYSPEGYLLGAALHLLLNNPGAHKGNLNIRHDEGRIKIQSPFSSTTNLRCITAQLQYLHKTDADAGIPYVDQIRYGEIPARGHLHLVR